MPSPKRFYARVEPKFILHDHRYNSLRTSEREAYIRCWCLSVEMRSPVLKGLNDSSTRARSLLGVSAKTLHSLLRKCTEMEQPLLIEGTHGDVTVCGITKLHPFIGQDTGPYQDQDQDQDQEEEERPTPQAKPKAKPKPKPKQPLFWQQHLPWFAENIHRFEEIKDPERFVSRICSQALEITGATWPDLQKRLLNASQYLEAPDRKIKDPGRFYINQLTYLKPSVTHDNTSIKPPAPREPKGWVRFENGVYFGADDKPLNRV